MHSLLWSSNSPDLSPVDYTAWCVLQERVNREKIRTVDELQHRITEECEHLGQCVIENAVKQWRMRLPIFGLRLLWPNGWMDQDATWYGGRRGQASALATLC